MAKNKLVKIREVKPTVTRIEDIPLIALNIKIIKLMSLILSRQMWRRYFSLITVMSHNATQFLQLYHGNETADVKIRNGFMSLLMFNTHLRAVHMCWKRKEYEEFLEYFLELYVELREMVDVEIKHMLENCTLRSQKLSKYNLLSGYMVSLGMSLYPLFAKDRLLVFSVYIPFVDVYESPSYEVVYWLQVSLTSLGASMYIPFTVLVVTFILFAILMCQVLQSKLRKLTNVRGAQALPEIIWCIKYQLKMIRFIDGINSLTTMLFLVEYLFYGTMLCTLLFSMIISTTFIQIIILSVYIVMLLLQSFLMYYYANELYEESAGVANAAYEVNWFDCDIETQQTLKLLILRSQKSCAILIANVYPMNLRKLQSLFNATYSFYTLLKRLYG